MQIIHAEMNGARPRCYEDADIAALLENIEFCTFTDEQAHLQAVVNIHGGSHDDEDGELAPQQSMEV